MCTVQGVTVLLVRQHVLLRSLVFASCDCVLPLGACSMAAAEDDDLGVPDAACSGEDPGLGVADATWLEPKMEYDDGSEAEWPEESWGQSWCEDIKGDWSWGDEACAGWTTTGYGKGYGKGGKGYKPNKSWASGSSSDSSRGTYVRDGFVNNRGDFFPPGHGRARDRIRAGRKEQHKRNVQQQAHMADMRQALGAMQSLARVLEKTVV
eukprot:s2541_g5.t1